MAWGCGTDSAKACESSVTARRSRALPSSWARMCSWAAGKHAETLLSATPSSQCDQSKPWNSPRHTSSFSCISATASPGRARSARAAALGVGRQRLLELLGEPEVVHDQPARLVLEHPVHPGDRLHQPVPAHRLVEVHGVEAWRVEPGQPHVAHDDDLERVGRVAEALGQASRRGLFRMCCCHSRGSGATRSSRP
jgi:hypothetical protein